MLRVVEEFTRHVYDTQMYRRTTWRGMPVQKYPTDLWAYAELLHETMPDVIIETGTYAGGSAHYLADLLHLYGKDTHHVISVDINAVATPHHPNISYIRGSSTAEEVVADVLSLILPEEKVMVILDSDHSFDHVHEELDIYAPLVSPGQYLVIEDTIVNGHPVEPHYGPGPMEAMLHFKEYHELANAFIPDRRWERYGITFHPRGFFQRKRTI